MAIVIPESPRMLFALGKIEEGKRAINFIAKLNCRKPLQWDQEKSLHRIIHLYKKNFLQAEKPTNFRAIQANFPVLYAISVKNVPPETNSLQLHSLLQSRMGSSVASSLD